MALALIKGFEGSDTSSDDEVRSSLTSNFVSEIVFEHHQQPLLPEGHLWNIGWLDVWKFRRRLDGRFGVGLDGSDVLRPTQTFTINM